MRSTSPRAARRRGIATELLRRVIVRAGERGCGRISLSVNFDNPSAHLYRRLGVHEIDSDDNSWIMVATSDGGPPAGG
jgi:ribosomal protein S18 acetylase RimI-like enzyme